MSSMVEDASFLVHKSLRRSVSTRSEQAIMAVCNRVTEVRSMSDKFHFLLRTWLLVSLFRCLCCLCLFFGGGGFATQFLGSWSLSSASPFPALGFAVCSPPDSALVPSVSPVTLPVQQIRPVSCMPACLFRCLASEGAPSQRLAFSPSSANSCCTLCQVCCYRAQCSMQTCGSVAAGGISVRGRSTCR